MGVDQMGIGKRGVGETKYHNNSTILPIPVSQVLFSNSNLFSTVGILLFI